MDQTKEKNRIIVGCLCAAGSEIIFGLSYIFTKNVTTENIHMFTLLGWRFVIAAATMTICIGLGIIKINFKNKSIKPVLRAALFVPCLYFIGETIGIRYTTASESGVFLSCTSVASIAASTLILKKKPTRNEVVGIVTTLIGVLITVVVVGVSARFSLLGYAFLLMGVISFALYAVFSRKAIAYSEAEITYIMLIAGAVVYGLCACIEAYENGTMKALILLPFHDHSFLIAVLYQGIGCSIFAFFMSNMAIARIGVNRTSSFYGVSTVVSIFAGALFLHEMFTWGQWIGAGIIILGIYIANKQGLLQR